MEPSSTSSIASEDQYKAEGIAAVNSVTADDAVEPTRSVGSMPSPSAVRGDFVSLDCVDSTESPLRVSASNAVDISDQVLSLENQPSGESFRTAGSATEPPHPPVDEFGPAVSFHGWLDSVFTSPRNNSPPSPVQCRPEDSPLQTPFAKLDDEKPLPASANDSSTAVLSYGPMPSFFQAFWGRTPPQSQAELVSSEGYEPPSFKSKKAASLVTVEEGISMTSFSSSDENAPPPTARALQDARLAAASLSNKTQQGGTADPLANSDDEIPSKVPRTDDYPIFVSLIENGLAGPYILIPIFALIAAGLLFGASKEIFGFELNLKRMFDKIDWEKDINVAFIGNAYFFVNDVPRVLEAISEYHVHQNSLIHPSASLSSLLITGNGMYKVWRTEEADIGDKYYTNNGKYSIMYDYGACTLDQIFLGHDAYIGYGNTYGAYYNDGLNPCIVDPYYSQFIEEKYSSQSLKWDYVILADQTKRMAIQDGRNGTLASLANYYAPLLNISGAIPVIVDTHAFYSENTNMTGLGDIPEFTALIYEGVNEYKKVLASHLPHSRKPIVAPVGLAYLTVWEEKPEVWEALFVNDMMHASVYGTYLCVCVLYMTLFGHRLPDSEINMPENVPGLFYYSRKLVGKNIAFPTAEEASYLLNVATRVALKGHVPSSFKKYKR